MGRCVGPVPASLEPPEDEPEASAPPPEPEPELDPEPELPDPLDDPEPPELLDELEPLELELPELPPLLDPPLDPPPSLPEPDAPPEPPHEAINPAITKPNDAIAVFTRRTNPRSSRVGKCGPSMHPSSAQLYGTTHA
ncbi:MAG TPA: hypothetical protein VF765_35010 [Polyangiaceae bacterium]